MEEEEEYLLRCQEHLTAALSAINNMISLVGLTEQQEKFDEERFNACFNISSAKYAIRRAAGQSQYIEED